MTPVDLPSRSARLTALLSAVVGGLVVLVLGVVLIATDVIDVGDTKTVVRESSIVQPAGQRQSGSRSVRDIYRKEGRGVVFVQARGVSDSSIFGLPQGQSTATGSGFVVDHDGTILTNAHVVEGADQVTVRFSENGPEIDATVKGRDPSTDLAVLKIDAGKAKDAAPLPLGDSSKAQVGDPVIAIGNPFGFARTVTTGIVSALQRQITAPNGFPIRNVIQTDASINPGNSGGPLLDSVGRVIGINSQIATGGGQGSVGIGFAIPVDIAKKLLPRLEKGGKIQRAYLGVNMTTLTAGLAHDLNLPVKRGALIQSVVPGGPAARAGLRGGRTQLNDQLVAGGDVLVEVDGKPIRTADDVQAAIADHKPGDRVTLAYYRGNKRRTASLKLGTRPSRAQPQSAPGGDVLPLP